MRVLVTGSRDWPEPQVVRRELDRAYDDFLSLTDDQEFVVVHGDCPTGADRHAAEWAAAMNDAPDVPYAVVNEPHPADWSKGRSAGPERNLHMVKLGADLCLAFIGDCTSPRCWRPEPHASHGASGCANLAAGCGVPTRRFAARRATVAAAQPEPQP